MSTITETETVSEETPKSPKTLTAKRIKRRMDKIGASSQPRNVRRKRAKLAQTVLGQIDSGQIRNPKAAAAAFVAAVAEQDAAMADVPADDSVTA